MAMLQESPQGYRPVKAPPLSIIIEWENAGRIGVVRARRMMAQLHLQLSALPPSLDGRPEILLMYNEALTSRQEVEALVRAPGREDWPADVRYLAAIDGSYYEQKNFGAANTSGDVIIFLDSDVVPEPGWLAALLDSISDPQIEVVCGATSIEPEGFYSAAVALFWFFPTKGKKRNLIESRRFFANNVAFRRSLFEKHNFPPSGQYRGQCALLAEELMANGHRIWRNRAAHVLHPAPEGFKHFTLRALWHGHDDMVHKTRKGGGASLRAGTFQFVADARRSWRIIRRQRRTVGLGTAGAAGALALGLSYYALKYIGYVMSSIRPKLVSGLLTKADI